MRKVFFGIMFLIFLMCGNRPIFAVTVPLTPESQAGTCTWNRDPNAANPKSRGIYIESYTCDIKNGWGPGLPTKEEDNSSYPGLPNRNCQCVAIPWFKPNTCLARFQSSWFTRMYNWKYYYAYLYNFCGDGLKPEAFFTGSLLPVNPGCRCISVSAPMSKDALVPGNEIPDPNDPDSKVTSGGAGSGTTSEPGQVNITSIGTGMFCENNGVIDKDNPKVKTAIGCLPVTINGFIGWIIPNLFGIIGGIAFLIMIYGFIMMSASDGDPKKAAAAKETITAAITGLLLSIFAIFLVRLIMLYILKLPGVK